MVLRKLNYFADVRGVECKGTAQSPPSYFIMLMRNRCCNMKSKVENVVPYEPIVKSVLSKVDLRS
jgi:hypothetical protein